MEPEKAFFAVPLLGRDFGTYLLHTPVLSSSLLKGPVFSIYSGLKRSDALKPAIICH